jgi:hypothetical protein
VLHSLPAPLLRLFGVTSCNVLQSLVISVQFCHLRCLVPCALCFVLCAHGTSRLVAVTGRSDFRIRSHRHLRRGRTEPLLLVPAARHPQHWPSIKMAAFWVVAPCGLVDVYRRFRCTLCLLHQGCHPYGVRVAHRCLFHVQRPTIYGWREFAHLLFCPSVTLHFEHQPV